MNITIIGAGNVGSALGEQFKNIGHNITFGVRNINDEKYTRLKDFATLNTPIKAVENSQIVVLATPWSATEEILLNLNNSLQNKILIDCTNPLKPNLAGLELTGNTSGGEQVAQWASNATVVKAFNTTGFNIMKDPEINGNKTVMLIASDNDAARKTVKKLAEDIGFHAIEFGDLSSSRLLEPFALTWISLAYKHGLGRDFGFSIQKNK